MALPLCGLVSQEKPPDQVTLCWNSPIEGYKMNCDAAVNCDGRIRHGSVVRNNKGEILIAAAWWKITGTDRVDQAEACGD
ncbi:hypothetical protein TorRG33x02_229200 [Trema orientale]|uniref:RNase H type-1 domain-containing protein n=1 Tax=Trema orientale TaxID=63057 RepID=A0A2P5E6W6_TREOI|nr:hypothetical protein TorRG33x02_229200 [Trema orientale]